ncbi:MAG: TetR/AcrR family transcriptional regulator [Actinomycetota bacterium]|nr:TetR/AcrR family transcriptional regulator [Actinomycetota bacterium]
MAARSGVAKSTIYRHWAGKDELLEDAFAELKPRFDVRVSGPVRDRITDLLEQLATHIAGSDWSSCLPAMIEAAERDSAARKLQRRISTKRRKLLLTLLRRASPQASCHPTSIPTSPPIAWRAPSWSAAR